MHGEFVPGSLDQIGMCAERFVGPRQLIGRGQGETRLSMSHFEVTPKADIGPVMDGGRIHTLVTPSREVYSDTLFAKYLPCSFSSS
jgi:hypothetical protein